MQLKLASKIVLTFVLLWGALKTTQAQTIFLQKPPDGRVYSNGQNGGFTTRLGNSITVEIDSRDFDGSVEATHKIFVNNELQRQADIYPNGDVDFTVQLQSGSNEIFVTIRSKNCFSAACEVKSSTHTVLLVDEVPADHVSLLHISNGPVLANWSRPGGVQAGLYYRLLRGEASTNDGTIANNLTGEAQTESSSDYRAVSNWSRSNIALDYPPNGNTTYVYVVQVAADASGGFASLPSEEVRVEVGSIPLANNTDQNPNSLGNLEYWWNDEIHDRFGVNISNGTWQDELVTDHLSDGLHTLHYRFRSSGIWSSVQSSYFLKQGVSPDGISNLAVYEYWWNNTEVEKTSGTLSGLDEVISLSLDTDHLGNGLHTFHLRTRDTHGVWGGIQSSFFLKQGSSTHGTSDLIAYEYWWNNAEKEKTHGTLVGPEDVISLSLDTDHLGDGLHTFHLRSTDTRGVWSGVQSSYFLRGGVVGGEENRIVAYRYWFGDDIDEFGNFLPNNFDELLTEAIVVDLDSPVKQLDLSSPLNIPPNLSPGFRTVHFQFLDERGLWGGVLSSEFSYEQHVDIRVESSILNLMDTLVLFQHGGTAHFYVNLINETNEIPLEDFTVVYQVYRDGVKLTTSQSDLSDNNGRADLNIQMFQQGEYVPDNYDVLITDITAPYGYSYNLDLSALEPLSIEIVPLQPTSRTSGLGAVAQASVGGCLGCVGVDFELGDIFEAEAKASLLSGTAGLGLGIDIGLSAVRSEDLSTITGFDITIGGDLGIRGEAKGLSVSGKAAAGDLEVVSKAEVASAGADINFNQYLTFESENPYAALQALHILLEQSLNKNSRRWYDVVNLESFTFNESKLQLFRAIQGFLEERNALPGSSFQESDFPFGYGYSGRLAASVGFQGQHSLKFAENELSTTIGAGLSGVIGFGYQKDFIPGEGVKRSFSTLAGYDLEANLSVDGALGKKKALNNLGIEATAILNKILFSTSTTFAESNSLFEMSTRTSPNGTLMGSELTYGSNRTFRNFPEITLQENISLLFDENSASALRGIASENGIAAYLSQDSNALAFLFDANKVPDQIAELSGYLVSEYKEGWGDTAYTGQRSITLSEQSTWSPEFGLGLSLGAGGKISFKSDFYNYNKNTYLLGYNVFNPSSGVLEPLVEHRIDPTLLQNNLDLYYNAELDFLTQEIEMALDQFKEDLNARLDNFKRKVSKPFTKAHSELYLFKNNVKDFFGSFESPSLNRQLSLSYGVQTSGQDIVTFTQDDVNFSTIEIIINPDEQVFPEGTEMAYEHFSPDGEVYGNTLGGGAFLAISDVIFFSAKNQQGNFLRNTNLGTYQVNAIFGSADLDFSKRTSNDGGVSLYFRTDDEADWELLSDFDQPKVEQSFEFDRMGRFVFGVSVDTNSDVIAPEIQIDIPDKPASNEEVVRISWNDDQGLNLNAIAVVMGETEVSIGDDPFSIEIPLKSFPSESGTLLNVEVVDHAGNIATSEITHDMIKRLPEDISLSSYEIAENNERGVVVGLLEASDLDFEDVHQYEVLGESPFTINGKELIAEDEFDFELAYNYEVVVRVTDSGGLIFDKTLMISVTNVNEEPTEITLDHNTISENQEIGVVVGELSTHDLDATDTHSYEVIGTVPFIIDGNKLLTTSVLDFEKRQSYQVSVLSTDVGGLTVQNVFEIIVRDTNDSPILIEPIDDFVVNEDESFTIDVLSSNAFDEDGDNLLIEVTGLPSKASFIDNMISGIPDQSDVGVYLIVVKYTDPFGQSVTDSFDLSIRNVNDAPTVVSGLMDVEAAEGVMFEYQLPENTFSDEDGDLLTISVIGLPSNLLYNPLSSVISGVPKQEDLGIYVVVVKAEDPLGLFVIDSFELLIASINEAPILVTAIEDVTTAESDAFELILPAGVFTDSDGDELTIVAIGLPDDISFDESSLVFSGTPEQAAVGTNTVTVIATDPSGASAHDSFNLIVTNVNDLPVVTSAQDDLSVDEDATFEYTIPSGTFSDEDGDDLILSVTGLPASLSFDATTRKITGTPLQADVAAHTIEVTATDPSGEAITDSFELTVSNVNDAPVLATAQADQVADEDAVFAYEIPAGTFTDEDRDDLILSVSGLPASLGFDPITGKITGTPLQAGVGVNTVTVTATDPSDAVATDSFDLTIVNVNDAPVIETEQGDVTTDEDAAFEYTVPDGTFSDEDEDDLTLSVTGLPSSLSFDASTRMITGTPLQADVAVHTIEVTATDPSSGAITDSFELTISNVNDAPVLAVAQDDQTADEDAAFEYEIPAGTFTDEDGDALTLTVSGLPSVFNFDASTNKITGTPLITDVGNYTIEVSAVDPDNASATDNFELIVAAVNDAPVVVTELPDVQTDRDAAFELAIDPANVTDEEGDAIAISASGLPASLTMTDGTISGTPVSGDNGDFTVTITYSDGNGGSVTDSFILTVNLVTSLEEEREFGRISVQPNPFVNEIRVLVEKGLFGETKFLLQPVGGKSVWNSTKNLTGQTEMTLDINKPMAEGIYLLIIMPKGKSPIVRKVIKEE